jgi:hypothetical protein
MKNVVYVSAHPDIPYFHWQTKVYTHNFINLGIKPENIHVLFVMVQGATEPTSESLELKKLGINVHHYLDDRQDKRYIPSLRPLAISRWLKENPELKECYFYHDSDIIFREIPDFESMMSDEVCYVSDTIGYIGHDYVSQCGKRYESQYPDLEKNYLLNLMTNIIGVDLSVVQKNQENSGGAQYFLKNVGHEFWEKVYDDCSKLYFSVLSFDRKHQIPHGGLQIWTADMWALLWNLWLFGKETKVTPLLDFSWATDTLQRYEQAPILHMAGVTDDLKATKFYKGEFINQDPLEKLSKDENYFDYIEENSSTNKYIEVMKSYLKKQESNYLYSK